MDSRRKVTLLKARIKLLKDLDLSDLLEYLIQWEVISIEDSAKIKVNETQGGQAQCLLDILPRRGASAFEAFSRALLETNQRHLQETLHETLDNVTAVDIARAEHREHKGPGMSLRNRVALTKTSGHLLQDLNVMPVLNELLGRLVISHQEFDTISREKTRTEQVEALLTLLPLKDDRAFDEFSQLLVIACEVQQDWLHKRLIVELKDITADDLHFAQYVLDQFGVVLPVRESLQRELRERLGRKLKEENTSLAQTLLKQASADCYIVQPASGEHHRGEDQSRPISVSNVCHLLEECPPGERIIIYGDAGMGKTTLLRQLAQLWVNGNHRLSHRFDYVFLIRNRSVKSNSLADVIFQDEKLLSPACQQKLELMLETHPERILFLLDSYEELIYEAKDLNKLISRDILATSTVVVTSRPEGNLIEKEEDLIPRITVELQNLPEEQVIENIKQYSHGQKDAVSTITEAFFDMQFLRRPIIMVLACFLCSIMSSNSTSGLPTSQTALYNLVLQHILLAYVMKKKGVEFKLTSGSPLENEALPLVAKNLLWKVGEMSYNTLKRGKQLCRFSKEEFKDFGLFIDCPDAINTVVLPHLSFQEFWAAMYLAADLEVWDDLFEDLQKSRDGASRRSLRDVLNPLENVAKFLVGFSPEAVVQLSSLFVIKQQKTWHHWYQSNLQYELELLHECHDDSMKSVVATALLNAPVVPDHQSNGNLVSNNGSYVLLDYFSEQEALTFLERAYGYRIFLEGKRAVLEEIGTAKHIWDSYVVACVFSYNCAIWMEELRIVHSHLLVDMLTQNMTNVRKLQLKHCTLCDKTPEFLSSIERKRSRRRPNLTNTSIEDMALDNVQGLVNLSDIAMKGTRSLRLSDCGEVNVSQLRHTFAELAWLRLEYDKFVYSAVQTRWTSVLQLEIVVTEQVNLHRLSEIFSELDTLQLWSCTALLEHPRCKWRSLKHFDLFTSPLQIRRERFNEKHARNTLMAICPGAEIVIKAYEMGIQRAKREDMERRAADRAKVAGTNIV